MKVLGVPLRGLEVSWWSSCLPLSAVNQNNIIFPFFGHKRAGFFDVLDHSGEQYKYSMNGRLFCLLYSFFFQNLSEKVVYKCVQM